MKVCPPDFMKKQVDDNRYINKDDLDKQIEEGIERELAHIGA